MNKSYIPSPLRGRFWVISAEMGYGHQRAIYPFRELSFDGGVLVANRIPEAENNEKILWKLMLGSYEFMSRARKVPVIGIFFSIILDTVLHIPDEYPKVRKPGPSLQSRFLNIIIRLGFAKGLKKHISTADNPLITSFYLPAIAANRGGHKRIFCIICDTDLSRVWVPNDTANSRIVYFAPGTMAAKRLESYGVPQENIRLTGFPLPLELLGDRSLDVLRRDLMRRLRNLDPNRFFINLYCSSVGAFLGSESLAENEQQSKSRCLTITFAVGGAGAQKEIGLKILTSLAPKIRDSQVKLNLVAGTRRELRDYFNRIKKEMTPGNENVSIIWGEDSDAYFSLFNECLHNTDILWTKPSELSFYSALGLPVIISPAIGPQEKYNRRWLRDSGVGFKQRSPEYTHQWLFELLEKGRLAEAAWLGFLKGRKYGTYNIIDFLTEGKFVASNDPLKR